MTTATETRRTKNPAQAQGAGSGNATEQTKPAKTPKPFNPTDVNFFLENLQLSEVDMLGADPYKWNPKATPQHWGIVWRHTKDIENEREALRGRGVFLAEKDGAIFTQPFAGPDGLFLDSSFDKDTGRIHSKYRLKDPESGTWAPEMVCYVRPMGAQLAAMKRIVERVKEKTERKPEKRKSEQREEIMDVARALTNSGGVAVEIEEEDNAGMSWETV